MKGFKKWFIGLLSVVITSVANTVVVSVVDPNTFSFTHGLKKLGEVCAATILLHGAAYLQKSPIWNMPQEGQNDTTDKSI